MGDIWASLCAHSMTRTSSHPCVFLIDIVLYWPRFVESLQYLHQWNKCFVYVLYDACMIYICVYVYIYVCICVCMCICIYIYMCVYVYIYICICMYVCVYIYIHILEYLHDEIFVKLYFRIFLKQIWSCHGTGFVVAGGTAGCHNNLRCRQGWQSGLYGSSRLFNVQCIQCTHDLSLLAPIFHPKLSKMLHSSLVRARYGVSFVSYGFWW